MRNRFRRLYVRVKNRLKRELMRWGMVKDPFFHRGEVEAQIRFHTRDHWQGKADRIIFDHLKPDYIEFIKQREFFFISTADKWGRCDCAFRGLDEKAKAEDYPALLVEDERTLLFPDYTGNGLYQSFGNLLTNPYIGMLFIDFGKGLRARVNGKATIIDDSKQARCRFGPSANRMIKVDIEEVLANCPKHMPKL